MGQQTADNFSHPKEVDIELILPVLGPGNCSALGGKGKQQYSRSILDEGAFDISVSSQQHSNHALLKTNPAFGTTTSM